MNKFNAESKKIDWMITLVPLVQTMIPMEIIDSLLAESSLAPIFMNGNLITAIMNKQLF